MARIARLVGVFLLLIVAFSAGWIAARLGIGSRVPTSSLTELERQFTERMRNVSLVGFFSVAGQEGQPARPDRYDIASVEKVGDDRWRFDARIRYGSIDVTLPVTVTMSWTGDTPMIMLTDFSIPSMGTFTVRLFFYGDRYAGSWQHGTVGGHMWGRIEKQGVAPSAAPLPRSDLTLKDRSEWRALLKWPDSCEEAFQRSRAGDDGGLEFSRLPDGISLVSVLCASGSYQPSLVYIRLDDRQTPPDARVLRFPTYQSPDGTTLERVETAEIWGEPTIFAKEHRMAVLNLSRQTGDCGIWSRYDIGQPTPQLEGSWARLPCPSHPGPRAIPKADNPPRGWTKVSHAN
jgi:hypothetical protein